MNEEKDEYHPLVHLLSNCHKPIGQFLMLYHEDISEKSIPLHKETQKGEMGKEEEEERGTKEVDGILL